MSEPVTGVSTGSPPRRLCVFTTLIGQYEHLNEQPVAKRSTIPFICLTDDSELRSESWQITQVSPVFGMDPVRSQRDIKLRPHAHLPDFDASIYIDNSVLLTEPPERLVERHFPPSGLCLPTHSYRDSLLDEFLEVARLGLDDQTRVFEQLNHYLVDFPEVLQERPYWNGIMIRDHRNAVVREMIEVWAAHVHRYSRRDQLSVNVVFRQTGFTPDVMEIDNFTSWFHTWPHHGGRDQEMGMRRVVASLSPPVARIRELERMRVEQTQRAEQALADLSAQHDEALAKQAVQHEQALAQQAVQHAHAEAEEARLTEARLTLPSWRLAAAVSSHAHRHPRLARCVWRGVHLAWLAASLPHRLHPPAARRRPERAREEARDP